MVCRSRLGTIAATGLAATILLGACGGTPEPEKPTQAAPAVQAEADLKAQADAMQRTILEGAATGTAAGFGLGLTLGGGNKDDADEGAGVGFTIGTAAGTYVAFVQREYARREARLDRIKADLAKNRSEMETALAVMTRVAAAQKAELAAVQASLAAGTAQPPALSAEMAEASANLVQMQRTIDGAEARRAEFGDARKLTLGSGQTQSPIDPELALLANRIAAMRAVAADLAAILPASGT